MRINDNWHIEFDDHQCTLVHTTLTAPTDTHKGGKEKRRLFHFATVRQCLSRFVDESVKDGKEVEQILGKIDQLEKVINGFHEK